jgi:hypothetical protein
MCAQVTRSIGTHCDTRIQKNRSHTSSHLRQAHEAYCAINYTVYTRLDHNKKLIWNTSLYTVLWYYIQKTTGLADTHTHTHTHTHTDTQTHSRQRQLHHILLWTLQTRESRAETTYYNFLLSPKGFTGWAGWIMIRIQVTPATTTFLNYYQWLAIGFEQGHQKQSGCANWQIGPICSSIA